MGESNEMLFILRGLLRNPHIGLGDQVYQVREREGLGWEGPSVKEWSAAIKAAEEMLKRLEGGS